MATSGLIAMVAVLESELSFSLKMDVLTVLDLSLITQTRYMLSADTEFAAKGVGNVTKVEWHANHTFYRRLILEGLHAGTKSIIRIVNKWNENIFPIAKERTGDSEEIVPDSEEERIAANRQRTREDGGRGGIQELLAGMTLDDSDSSDSGDPTADAALDRDAEYASIDANPPASTHANTIADDLDDPVDPPIDNPVPIDACLVEW